MTKVIFWDIDGTLISTKGAGARALRQALRDCYGLEGDLSRVPWAGRSDRRIARMLLEAFGIGWSEAEAARFLQRYLALLPELLAETGGGLLPGVLAWLEAVAERDGFHQGLLTGNLRRGAEIKLGYFGVWDFFPFGGFADEGEDRNAIAGMAREVAARHLGVKLSGADILVIGDTPFDVECGKAIGARTLAVATGPFTAEQLGAHHPDVLLTDLTSLDERERVLGLLAS